MSTSAADDDAHDPPAASGEGPGVHLRSEMDVDPNTSAVGDLMRPRHGTPFEHSTTFHVQAPPFVFHEFQRHRIASHNEESGRYREHEPVFYTPAVDRKLAQVTEDAGRRRRP